MLHQGTLGCVGVHRLCSLEYYRAHTMDELSESQSRIQNDYQERNELHPHASKSLEEEYDLHINFRYIL